MDKKVEYIAELLGMENQDVALVLYTYLSKVLEDLVHNRYAVTIFGELVMDEENNLCGIVTDSDVFRALVDIFGFGQSASRITIDASDKPGVLAEITKMFADRGINIISCVTSDAKVAGEKEMTITADLSQVGLGIIEEIREAGYTVTNITTSRAK